MEALYLSIHVGRRRERERIQSGTRITRLSLAVRCHMECLISLFSLSLFCFLFHGSAVTFTELYSRKTQTPQFPEPGPPLRSETTALGTRTMLIV
jgi:hypothetical protein